MGRTWPAWTLAPSSKLAPSYLFATLHPFPHSGLHPGPGPPGTLASGAASGLEIIKEEVGNRSVGWQRFALSVNKNRGFFTGHYGARAGQGSWGAGTVPVLGVLTVHLGDKSVSALSSVSKGQTRSSWRCHRGGGRFQ